MTHLCRCSQGHYWDATDCPAHAENAAPPCPICHGDGTLLTALDAGSPDGRRAIPPAPPRKVGNYEILGLLGRGGMGVVYKARQPGLDRLVALKMVLAGAHADADQLARFHDEARAVARLQHPNIVQIYEVGEDDGRPFLALEFVEGGSLERKAGGAPQPFEASARLLEVLARAVHDAHTHDIVHRDLKPANILLAGAADADLDQCVPKVSDFGLAKQLDAPDSRTATGAAVGTPSYMAPEQAWGKNPLNPVGPAADVWALGAILYELLTGRPPFRGDGPLDTLEQVVGQEPVPPSRLRPRVPRDLETICLKCLEKEPGKRYASAAALADDLARMLRGEPVVARRAAAWERAAKWARRRPAVATLSLAVVTVTLIGFALVTWQLLRAEEQRGRAESKAEEARRAQGRAEEERGKARRVAAALARDRGVALCEQGEVARGLFWLARGLENAPPEDAELCGSLRLLLAGWGEKFHRLRGVNWPAAAAGGEGEAKDVTAGFRRDGRSVVTIGARWTAGRLTALGGRSWDAVTGGPTGQPPWEVAFDGKAWALEPVLYTGVPPQLLLSPDAETLLLAPRASPARLLDAATGRPRGKPLGQLPDLRGAAFSPDGRRLVTVARDLRNKRAETRLWDAVTGDPVGPGLVEEGAVPNVRPTFSADGRVYATAHAGEARVWSAATGEPLGEPLTPAKGLRSLALSPDGRLLATCCDEGAGGAEGGEVRLWRLSASPASGPPSPCPGPGGRLLFSPDGKVLVAVQTHAVTLWDSATGRPLGKPQQYLDRIAGAAFRPDGTLALVGGGLGGNGGRLWEPSPGPAPDTRPALQLRPRGVLGEAVFDPAAARFLIPQDGVMLLADVAPARCTAQPLPAPLPPVAGSIDGAHRLVVTVAADGTRIWDAATGAAVAGPLRDEGKAAGAVLAPDGTTCVTVARGEMRFWRLPTGEAVGEPLRLGGPAYDLWFARGGRALATLTMPAAGPGDPAVRLWDLVTGKAVGPAWQPGRAAVQRNFTFGGDGPLPRPVSPDGDLLALPAGKDKVEFRDAATGRRVGQALDHAGSPGVLVFSPDSKSFVTAPAEREVRLWDVATGRPLGEPLRHPERVLRADFSPDGRLLVTVSGVAEQATREVRLWRVPSGELIGEPLRSESPVLALAWAPGGKRLLAECADHARLWDAASGRPLGRIERFRGPGAFSPDGRIVVSRADERTVRLWDAVSGLPLGEPLRHPAALLDLGFSSDGRAVLTLGGDGHLRTWRLPSAEADAPEKLTLRLEAQTGLTMDEGGVVAELPADRWHERLRRLQEPVLRR